MANHRIKLIVEGLETDGGHVRLDVFVKELQKLQGALARADQKVSSGDRSSYFAIVGLSHSSPATIELEARILPNRPDARDSAVALLTAAIRSVERNEFTPDVDHELLSDIKALAAPVGSMLKTANLVVDNSTHFLTENIATRISEFLDDQEECFITIEGMLERVNVHGGANEFTIYPAVGAAKIKCNFPPELSEKGISAIRRRVAVIGLAKYRKFAPYPHEIRVDGLEVYALETELPTFDDLRGISPLATGNLSSEDFVQEIRHGWN